MRGFCRTFIDRQSSADYIELLQGRGRAIAAYTRGLEGFDAIASPTIPVIAPRIAERCDEDHFAAAAWSASCDVGRRVVPDGGMHVDGRKRASCREGGDRCE